MEESRKEKLLQAGVNIETAMERFIGNEELLIRFLKKFPEDPNYGQLKEAMSAKNYKDAFTAAHTLKGLCGNLSLNDLFELVSKETECLRHDQHDEAEEIFPELAAEYERVVAILETI